MEDSFQEKQLTISLVFFPLGACVDEFIDSQANYQGYRYDVHFLRCHTFEVITSVNGEGVCQIIVTNIFDVYILNYLMI